MITTTPSGKIVRHIQKINIVKYYYIVRILNGEKLIRTWSGTFETYLAHDKEEGEILEAFEFNEIPNAENFHDLFGYYPQGLIGWQGFTTVFEWKKSREFYSNEDGTYVDSFQVKPEEENKSEEKSKVNLKMKRIAGTK